MQYHELINYADEHLHEIRDAIVGSWIDLQRSCPSLKEWSSFGDFEEGFILKDCDRARTNLYREIIDGFFARNALVEAFLVLLFGKRLKFMIRILHKHYSYHEGIDDLWNVIVSEFFNALEEKGRQYPNVDVICTRTRSLANDFYRDLTARMDERALDRYFSFYPRRRSRVEEGRQYDSAVYNEIMGYIRSRLKPDEYEAICIRMWYEFYDRSKKKKKLKYFRNVPAERRALKKARYLLQNFEGDEGQRRRYLLM